MVQPLRHKGDFMRARLGEQAAMVLLNRIRLGEVLPGERLPNERHLCNEFGVNRTAVREGIRWLEYHHYVEIRRGRHGGAVVLPVPLELAVERIRAEGYDLGQLLEYRLFIEPQAAALAADRIKDDELARLWELHRRIVAEPGLSRVEKRSLDVAIHEGVALAARNEHLFHAVRDVRIRLASGLDLTSHTLSRAQESRSGHAELLAALDRHDPAAARKIMERHVAATGRAIATALADNGIGVGQSAVAMPARAKRAAARKAT